LISETNVEKYPTGRGDSSVLGDAKSYPNTGANRETNGNQATSIVTFAYQMDDFICMDPKNNVINESSIQPVRHGQGRRLRPIDGSDNPVRKRTVPLKPKAVTIVPMQRFEWSQKIQSPPKRQSKAKPHLAEAQHRLIRFAIFAQ